MKTLLIEYLSLLISATITALCIKRILNQKVAKARRISRHIDASNEGRGSSRNAESRPWILEEMALDQGRIRTRFLVATVSAILTDITIADLQRRLLPLVILIEIFVVPPLVLADVTNKIKNELRQRVEIEANLPLEIEKLALYLGSGLSLNSSFYRLSKTSSEQTRPLFTFMAQGLQSGISLNDVLEGCYQRFPTESVRRITNLLAGGASGGDLVRVTREEAANQRSSRHLGALAKMEKVTQSVWIPITVAALLPGIAIVFIPFFSVLTSLKG